MTNKTAENLATFYFDYIHWWIWPSIVIGFMLNLALPDLGTWFRYTSLVAAILNLNVVISNAWRRE